MAHQSLEMFQPLPGRVYLSSADHEVEMSVEQLLAARDLSPEQAEEALAVATGPDVDGCAS